MSFYTGSLLLTPLANFTGLPIDRLNFVVAQILAFFLGLGFRRMLEPGPKNTTKRHWAEIVLGIWLSYFCYGAPIIHIVIEAGICYFMMLYLPRRIVPFVVFIFTMIYLTVWQIYRFNYDYGNYSVDITSAMMVATQKLTSMAFSYYDGVKTEDKLNEDQARYQIKEMPTAIEFLSYMCYFQGVIIGPLVFYHDYIDYITGENLIKHKKMLAQTEQNGGIKRKSVLDEYEQPDNKIVIIKKLIQLVILIYIYFNFTLIYTGELNLKPEVLDKPVMIRFVINYLITVSQRSMYYLAWVLSDLVHNASGLGFNGYDEKGNAVWDLCTSVNILKLETSTSLKTFLDNWNIQTTRWFRRMAYDRMPSGKTFAVFCLSAYWHGFYPGYYLTFISAALFVYAGRGIRQNVRPLFQNNKASQMVYEALTWFGTIWAVNYGATSFLLLELGKSLQFYRSWYYHVHIIAIIALLLPSKRKTSFMAGKTASTKSE